MADRAQEGQAISTRIEHALCILCIQATDGNQRFGDHPGNLGESSQANDRIRVNFPAGLKNWPDGYNIDRRIGLGNARLGQVMSRAAHQHVRGNDGAGGFGRQVVLAEMDAQDGEQRGDVGAVVDPQALGSRRFTEPFDGSFNHPPELPIRNRLGAQLNPPDPGMGQGTNGFVWRDRMKSRDIGDRVEKRNLIRRHVSTFVARGHST